MTPALLARLQAMGWSVALFRLSDTASARDGAAILGNVPVVEAGSGDEAGVRDALARIREQHGSVAVAIYLHAARVEGVAQRSAAEAVRAPFLLAKHLADDLNGAASRRWAGFVAVTRIDGELGVSGALADGLPDLTAGGLPGLVKTLRLEWPQVACRAVDLTPELPPDEASRLLVGEILDPNRTVSEVGWGPRGRVTIETTPSGSPELYDGV